MKRKTILKNKPKRLNLFSILTWTFFILVSGLLLSPLFIKIEPNKVVRGLEEDDNAPKLDSSLTRDVDSCLLQGHRVKWKDYDNRLFSMNLAVCINDYTSARENRKNTLPGDYTNLIVHDSKALNKVALSFFDLAKENNLGYAETAKLVVSCIQEIPYYLVIAEDKNEYINYLRISGQTNSFAYQYLINGEPFIDNIETFGVQSPAEFMYNLKGDCDTRTVMLYTVLQKLGYDVVVLNSNIQSHSILGIQLPRQRADETFYDRTTGKKYYVWETTAKGYIPGVMPFFDESEWFVAVR